MSTIFTNDESHTAIDFDDLVTQVNHLHEFRDEMDEGERTFVSSMLWRIRDHGVDTFISLKQKEWLDRLEQKYPL